MFLGIEIGGTKLQLGLGQADCPEFVELVRSDVNPDLGAAGIRQQILVAVRELRQRHTIDRIGFGFGGPVLAAAGRVIKSHQITGWDDFPLIEWCRSELGLPAVIGNDCDVAALAEARYGAGRGHRTVLYVTVGTGIGGGLVIDGRIHGTDRPAAVEIGHLRPGLDAIDRESTVEAIASGRGLERAAREWLLEQVRITSADSNPSVRNDLAGLLDRCHDNPDRMTARALADAAAGGNQAAIVILGRGTTTLGWAIAQAATLIAPEVVVVGGGVSLIGDRLFFKPVRESVDRYLFPPLIGTFEIVPASLGESVVVHGALALAAG